MQQTTDTQAVPAVAVAPVSLAYVPATRNEVIKVISLGVASGVAIVGLAGLVFSYFVEPYMCGDGQMAGLCSAPQVLAEHIAALIVGVAAFFIMTRWGVYRALLLVLAATVAMWGLKKYAEPLTMGSVLEYYLFAALLYGLAYGLFYWILRLRNFAASLVLTVAAVAASCWAMVAW